MELGDKEQARIQLTKITNESSFDYLIIKSKWEDANGNLSKAIAYLEQAKNKAIASNNKTLLAWIFSNIGDYYGHNGEIEKAYDHFTKTLELDPAELAELAAYEKKDITGKMANKAFQNAITNRAYGDMYNKYECLLAADPFGL